MGSVEAGTRTLPRPVYLLKRIRLRMTSPPSYSVLLVEDEVMIRMMVADMLEELGHAVAGEAGEIGQAIQLVQSIEFDLRHPRCEPQWADDYASGRRHQRK